MMFLALSLIVMSVCGLESVELLSGINSISSGEFEKHVSESQYRRLLQKEFSTVKKQYIAQLQIDGNKDSRSKLVENFGDDAFNYISRDRILLFSAESALEAASKEGLIESYTRRLPYSKIHKKVVSSTYRCQKRRLEETEQEGNAAVQLHVTVAPMDAVALAAFEASLNDEVDNIGKVQKHAKQTDMVPNRKHMMVVEVSCEKAMDAAAALSSKEAVLWVEERPAMGIHTRWAKGVVQTATYDNVAIYDTGLTGQGQIIGFADTGIDLTSCYFEDPDMTLTKDGTVNASLRKVIYYNPYVDDSEVVYSSTSTTYSAQTHGTQVCGAAAGNPYSDKDYGDYQKYRGLAYSSQIAFFDIGSSTGALTIPADINTDLLQPLYDAGSRILSNSWGSSSTAGGTYSTDAQNVDDFMVSNPEALVLFSAGNDGTDGSGSVSSTCTSKNGMCVGSTFNAAAFWDGYYGQNGLGTPSSNLDYTTLVAQSGRGPTETGRLKPDVLAPGSYVTSAKPAGDSTGDSHCDVVTTESGGSTSMATALTAGAAALVREYFVEGYYQGTTITDCVVPSGALYDASCGFIPSGALIKAMLLNSGQQITLVQNELNSLLSADISEYPSVAQGFGRLQLDKVLQFGAASVLPVSLFVLGAASTTSPMYREITGQGLYTEYSFTITGNARITLTYTDPVPTVASNSTDAYNNLDFVVFYRNTAEVSVTLSPWYYATSAGVEDNVKMLDIEYSSLMDGRVFTLRVTGTTILTAQSYALVMTSANEMTVLAASASTETEVRTSGSGSYIAPTSQDLIIIFSCVFFILSLVIVFVKRHNQPDTYFLRMLELESYNCCPDDFSDYSSSDSDSDSDEEESSLIARRSAADAGAANEDNSQQGVQLTNRRPKKA